MPSAVARLGNRLSLQSFGIDYPAVITGYNEMAPPCTAREGNREDRKGGRAGTNVLNTPRNNCIYTSTSKMNETKICKMKVKIRYVRTKEDTNYRRCKFNNLNLLVPEMTKRVKKFVKNNGKVRSDGTISVAKRKGVRALRHVFR